MIFTRRPRRSIKGNKYAHRVLLARAAREQRGSQFAILGTLLATVAVLFTSVGWIQNYRVTSNLDLSHLEDTPEVRARLEGQLATLNNAVIIRNIGGLALIIGGGLVTLALLVQRLRKRWFFFSTLALSMILLFVPVMGTVFGVLWLACLYVTRREFVRYQPLPSS